MRRVIGIDPGLAGAIAVIGDGFAVAWDTPVLEVKNGKKRRREYEVPAMLELLCEAMDETYRPNGPRPPATNVTAVIEAVSPMPKEGVVSASRSGYGAGLWHALLVALEVPFRVVHPAVWKRAAGLIGKDKAYSRLVAGQRFPGIELGRVKDHGRAEALLLADYAKRLDW